MFKKKLELERIEKRRFKVKLVRRDADLISIYREKGDCPIGYIGIVNGMLHITLDKPVKLEQRLKGQKTWTWKPIKLDKKCELVRVDIDLRGVER